MPKIGSLLIIADTKQNVPHTNRLQCARMLSDISLGVILPDKEGWTTFKPQDPRNVLNGLPRTATIRRPAL